MSQSPDDRGRILNAPGITSTGIHNSRRSVGKLSTVLRKRRQGIGKNAGSRSA